MRHAAHVALVLLLASGPGLADEADPALALAGVERENRFLDLQLALAKQPEPYLVLDAGSLRLRLMRGGALLREFELRSVEIGEPEIAFVRRSGHAPAWESAPKLAGIRPARVFHRAELVEPDPDAPPAEPYIPPEPSEACPAPPRYFLSFDDGLSLEVRTTAGEDETAPSLPRRLSWRVRDLFAALRWNAGPRLRVVLEPSEAGALYRAVPESAALLVSPR